MYRSRSSAKVVAKFVAQSELGVVFFSLTEVSILSTEQILFDCLLGWIDLAMILRSSSECSKA